MAKLPAHNAMALIDKSTVHEKAEQSINDVKAFLCLITCVDTKLLAESTESERKKYTSLGVAMLITTLLSFFSAYIAYYYIFPEIKEFGFSTLAHYSRAISFSLIWMLIIFNLQRFVLSGDSRTSDSDRVGLGEVVRALPAIVMAILIGIVVAIPLEVAIFKPEIDIYLKKEQERKFLAAAETIEQRSLSARQQACAEFYRYQQAQGLPLIRCLPRSNGEVVLLQTASSTKQEATEIPASDRPASVEAPDPASAPAATSAAGSTFPSADTESATVVQASAPKIDNREPELDSIREALDNIAKQARQDSLELLRQEEIDQLGGGLVFRAAALFKNFPFFAYSVMLIIVFVQLTPVLIKMMAAKSPYDYQSEMQNRLIAAAGRVASEDDSLYHLDRRFGGIEINAVAVYGRHGEGKPVTLYHGANEIESIKREQFAAENRKLEQQRLAVMKRRFSRLEKLTSSA